VTQRIRRASHETLEVDLLFDDPKAYTKPWAAKKTYQLRPDWEILEYIICESEVHERYIKEVLGSRK
jgi:hypothetical protein